MKRRIFSILFTLCMVLCLAQTSVFAEGETTQIVATEQELLDTLADDTVDVIKMKNDIEISSTLNVIRPVTLDLVGYMLEIKGGGSVITVKNGGHLTLDDSDLTSTYYFTPTPTACGNGVPAVQRPSTAASSTAAVPKKAAVCILNRVVSSP